MSRVRIGSVGEADLERLNDIYNHYVRTTPITFDIDEIRMEERRAWYAEFGPDGPYRLVGAFTVEGLVGYACSTTLFPRAAYATSVATSVYVAPEATGQGVGFLLYTALYTSLDGEDVHRAYGGITMPNDASVALHERFGFRRVAYFTEQGRKFGRYWDVAWYEKPL